MDSDRRKSKKSRSIKSNYFNGWNVLQSIRIRYPFLLDTEFNQFLLDYNSTFLPGVSVMFWFIFLIA
jgi:hypothetical protein